MILTRLIASSAIFPAILAAVAASSPSLTGLHSLVQRRIPQHADKFQFNIIDGTGDSFTVSDSTTAPGGITVECTTLSACARGLYTYAPPFPYESQTFLTSGQVLHRNRERRYLVDRLPPQSNSITSSISWKPARRRSNRSSEVPFQHSNVRIHHRLLEI